MVECQGDGSVAGLGDDSLGPLLVVFLSGDHDVLVLFVRSLPPQSVGGRRLQSSQSEYLVPLKNDGVLPWDLIWLGKKTDAGFYTELEHENPANYVRKRMFQSRVLLLFHEIWLHEKYRVIKINNVNLNLRETIKRSGSENLIS